MDPISIIVQVISKIVTTSLNLSRKRIERDTLEQKSQSDLLIAKEIAPAKIEQADQETKQALIRLTGAKIQSQSAVIKPENNIYLWLIFIIIVLAGIGFIFQSTNNNGRGNSNSNGQK